MQKRRVAGLYGSVGVALILCLCAGGCRRDPAAQKARFIALGKRNLDKKDYARAVLDFQNAVKAAPNDAEPYYQLALAQLGVGEFRTAVACLRKATELDPKHVAAQVRLAQMMATSQNPEVLEEAAQRAQAAFAVSPEDAAVLNTLALTEMRLDKPEDAVRHLQEALARFPGHLRSTVMLADVKIAQKDYPAAEELLKQAVAEAPGTVPPRLALYHFYRLTNKPAEGEQQLQEVLRLDPQNGPALLQLAQLRLRAGKKDEAERLYKQVSGLPDKTYRAAYALFLRTQGQAEASVTELKRLHQQDPSDRDVRSRLIAAYLSLNRAAEAQALLDAALKANPKDIQALLQRGAIEARGGKLGEAEQDLRRVLQFDPDSAEAHYHLAAVHRARGERTTARQELAEALRLRPGLLVARLELAQALLQVRDTKACLSLLDAAPESQKGDLRFLLVRNFALIGAGDFAAARKGVDQGLALARTPEFLLQDAQVKLNTKDLAGGRAALEQALKLNPEDWSALELLALTYVTHNQLPKAVETVKAYTSQRPASPQAQVLAGQWLRKVQRNDEARAALQAARKAAPEWAAPSLMLAELDIVERKFEPARKTLEELLAAKNSVLDARLLLGMLELESGNPGAAIGQFRAALDIDPNRLVALNNLAYLLVDHAKQPDEGLRLAQRAKELAPNDMTVEDTIGWAYYQKGLYQSAVVHLENAASKGHSVVPQYHLAMAYFKMGNRSQGERALKAALARDPKRPEAQQARQLWDEVSRTAAK